VADKKVVLTYDGLKKREEELDELKTIRRKEVAEKIKEARGQGDLSENAEYDAAKDEQAEIEARIATLEKMLKNAEVIDDDDIKNDVITIGSRVLVFDKEFDEETEYSIVGSAEADPMQNLISNESPVGRGLLGHKVGETVQIEVPEGFIEFEVRAINK